MAKESSVEADIVIPVPDSGVPAALGFAKASGVPFELGIVRNQFGITKAQLVFDDIICRFAPPYQLHPADQAILQMAILGQLMCKASARRPESRGVQCRDDATELDRTWTKWQIVMQSSDGGYIWNERVID